jgi:ABC-2 type transport system permease protein
MIAYKAIYVIVAREFKRFFRQKSRLLGTIARPLLWLIIIGSGFTKLIDVKGGITYSQFIVPGILGMTILFSSIFSTISVVWDREFGFLREMLVAPVSRFTIVLGKIISGTIIALFQGVLILTLAPLFGLSVTVPDFLVMIVLMALVAFAITSFGLLIASFLPSLEGFNVVMNFIVLPMFFLSGALYPVKVLPSILQYLSRINPLSYGIDAFKNIVLDANAESALSADFPLMVDISVVLVFSIIMIILASLSFERRG